MKTYTTSDGNRVNARFLPDGGSEFVTRNPLGEVISSVVKYGEEADDLRLSLICCDRAQREGRMTAHA